MIKINISNDWDEILENEFKQSYFKKLINYLELSYEYSKIYPNKNDIFNCLKSTSFKDTKVVIVGQDPYVKANQSDGYAFSVNEGINIPPTLELIFRQLEKSLNCYIPDNGSLIPWAEQGLLLLNSILTVEEGISGSHKNKGWLEFTDAIIRELNNKKDSLAFLLLGTYARKKLDLIDAEKHLVIVAQYPSILSNIDFVNCDYFKQINQYLKDNGKEEVDWQIKNIYK